VIPTSKRTINVLEVLMGNQILLYLGSAFLLIWGVSHLFPTRSVVKGFGDISLDNRRIITMEWIVEGVSMVFIGLLVATVTYIDYTSMISRSVCWISFVMLNALSVISLFTGFKVRFLPFKLCPVVFTTSSILILLGTYA
jgi:hypothetical protein